MLSSECVNDGTSALDVCATCKPGSIVFGYVPGTCASTTNQQSGKFTCTDVKTATGSGAITVTSSGVITKTSSGGFQLSSCDGGKLAANTDFSVFENGQLIQVWFALL